MWTRNLQTRFVNAVRRRPFSTPATHFDLSITGERNVVGSIYRAVVVTGNDNELTVRPVLFGGLLSFILLTAALVVIYQVLAPILHPPAPTKMSGDFNIAFADFAVEDVQGRV